MIHTGMTKTKFHQRDGLFTGIILDTGEQISAELLVIGIGVAPESMLADAIGAETGNGILVDRQMRTTIDDVYAIGDVVRGAMLAHKAEEEGQFSASINAEKTRSALGGLTVDRREQNHIHQLDKLSREEIVARLNQIRSEYPHAFIDGNFKKSIDGEESGKELLKRN